jgi:serine/threonine protein phosphatase PrpC
MLIQHLRKPPITSRSTAGQFCSDAGQVGEVRQPAISLRIGTATDTGIERKLSPNEDTLSVTHDFIGSDSTQPYALLIVADGMGGQGHGQEASRLAVGSLAEYVAASLCSEQAIPQTLLPLLEEGVQRANRVVNKRNREQRTDMGTTITAALIVDTTAYVAHVGDSRCYLYREPAGLSQVTHDHSLVAALVSAGAIQPEDIYTHPMRNVIYRHLGEKASLEVDTFAVPLANGDILLLCTDGLWEMVRDQQIAAILTSPAPSPSQTAHALIQAALASGGEDNVSVLVVQVDNPNS